MIKKLLHVIPSLPYAGAAKQLTLLSLGLPKDRFEVQVAVLGNDDTAAGLLREAGLTVHVLGKNRRVDLDSLWKLRRLARTYRPDVIHAWGSAALRSLAVVPSCASVVAGHLAIAKKARLGSVDRWLFGRAARIIARGQAEADRCRAAGLAAGKIAVVPPGVDNGPWQSETSLTALPQANRLVVCAGILEAHKGFGDAIWALDILRFLFDDLRLLLAGSGPDRSRLERFARRAGLMHRLVFLGPRADVPALLKRAELVWVPSLADFAGGHIALEAMAMGKPVVASNLPSLREILVDGETGFLIPPGDKVALARRTLQILRQPDLARTMANAGRRRAILYSPEQMIDSMVRVYADVAA